MDQEFKSEYAKLNTAQKQAVDYIDGPLLVIAGPGTGKTQLLSLRVANIIRKTDTDPGSILCLTFTNFAATNMRERLTKFIGPPAHNVLVRTFHSFAAEIMSLYPDYFWNGARLNLAPDAVQLEIIENILSGLPLDNPLALRFAGAYTALGDVAQALKLAKEAGLTPEKLSAMIDINLAFIDLIEPALVNILSDTLSLKKLPAIKDKVVSLPDQTIAKFVTPLAPLSTVLKDSLLTAIANDEQAGKTTRTSAWKRRWLQNINGQKGLFDERRRNGWWQAVAEVYKQYRDTLHLRGYYDYSDMIIEVTTQLEQHPELLSSVQERFMYVLIDEFQDTNAAQLRLAHLVSDSFASEGRPNLMAVGDDDQSIFAFNGAELNNLLAFRRTYKDTKIIILSDNYRSTQAVLDAAGSVIGQAEDRLVNRDRDLIKQLSAKTNPGRGQITHLVYPTREHQLLAIARRVEQQYLSKEPGTIAVLSRHHDGLRQLSSLLNKLNVPISYEQQNNVLNNPLIQHICLLAETVEAINSGDQASTNHYLSRLLTHPSWKIQPAVLWQLAKANFHDPDWLSTILVQQDSRLETIGKWLQWLSSVAGEEPLPVMLDYFSGLRTGEQLTSPLSDYYLSLRPVSNSYLEGLSALRVLKTAVKEFSDAQEEETKLSDFVRLIRLHRELERPITDQSWFMSRAPAVQLMSVHKAKGLEFDTVFLLDAIEDNWRPRRAGRKPPANLPLQPYGEQYDDYIRLLYVAITRAKRSVIISSYRNDDQGKGLLPSPLIDQIPVEVIDDESELDSIEVLEATLTWPRLESTDEQALLKNRLDNYSLSVTALTHFLDVSTGGPQHFQERHILRLPELTTANMAYGTAAHKALQTAQQLMNAGSFSLNSVLISFEKSLNAQQLPIAQTKRYQKHGQLVLTSLFEDRGFSLPKNAQAEAAFHNVLLGKASLTGKIDRLELEGDKLLITDYKTGKPLTSFSTKDRSKAIKAWRQHTQLLFYCLLASASGRFKDVSSINAQLVYIEAESAKQLTLRLAPDSVNLERLTRLINIVWQHILELNFPDTSHYSSDSQGIAEFEEDLLSGKI